MRTKEEIIKSDGNRHGDTWDGAYYSEDSVLEAMQTYADQETEKLLWDNFKLAAMTCLSPTSDDWANRTCNDSNVCMAVEIARELKAENEKFRHVLEGLIIHAKENGLNDYITEIADKALNQTKD